MAYQNEEEIVVRGDYEAIIPESLFFNVQDVLNGNKRKIRTGSQASSDELFVLRGFISCPVCGKFYTGSASKGRNNLYHYYHCQIPCLRHDAHKTNSLFAQELMRFVPAIDVTRVCSEKLKELYATQLKNSRSERHIILEEIDKINARLQRSRALFADQVLEAEDYSSLKKECSENISRLESKLAVIPEQDTSINSLIDKAIYNI